ENPTGFLPFDILSDSWQAAGSGLRGSRRFGALTRCETVSGQGDALRSRADGSVGRGARRRLSQFARLDGRPGDPPGDLDFASPARPPGHASGASDGTCDA